MNNSETYRIGITGNEIPIIHVDKIHLKPLSDIRRERCYENAVYVKENLQQAMN